MYGAGWALSVVRRLITSALGLATAVMLVTLPVSSAQASLTTTPVPYMGWNPYYASLGGSNEATFEAVANSLISTGLQNAGYRIFWLDFGWASGARDSSGQLVVDSTKWPDGMLGFTNWLHQHGFLAGIYTDAGPSGCSGQGVGSYGHYQQDADTFAAWGFDAVKVDFCGAGQQLEPLGYTPQQLYTQFSDAIGNNSSGRPMILNACNFWTPGQINGTLPTTANSSWDNFQWAPSVAQSWRTDTDIGFVGNIQFKWVLRNLDKDATHPEAAGPPSSSIAWGHWNDPDYLGPQLGMTSTQAQSQFSMWAMLAAPLILGSDPRTLSSSTLSMLENANVIAIDQDSLGAQGSLLSQNSTGQQVWVKPLAGGARAVALFNRGTSAAQITTTTSAAGLPAASRYTLLNAWTNQVSRTKSKITAFVQPDAVVLFRVTAG
jgi:alpha-galactosidase